MQSNDTAPELFILDGGLGTTLETHFKQNISSSLWSAKPVDRDPEVIIQAHLAFLRAGADVMLTSTYQCAFQTFAASEYTREDAIRIMRKSVKLADEARRRFRTEQRSPSSLARQSNSKTVKIALSLGPFGATLQPAQEFDGLYPPPYGPQGYSSQEINTNAFPATEQGRHFAEQSVAKLAEFHLERLRVFVGDKETWDLVDLAAFETVPLVREIRAIRRAVTSLGHEIGEGKMKPWWISTVWPGGGYPEESEPNGEKLYVDDVVQALLRTEDQMHTLARPWGVGINCTSLEHLPALVDGFSTAVRRSQMPDEERPWLVLYPNGGDTYNVVNRTWVPSEAGKGDVWADSLWQIAKQEGKIGMWEGIVVGGCCRTGPTEIEALARIVNTACK